MHYSWVLTSTTSCIRFTVPAVSFALSNVPPVGLSTRCELSEVREVKQQIIQESRLASVSSRGKRMEHYNNNRSTYIILVV